MSALPIEAPLLFAIDTEVTRVPVHSCCSAVGLFMAHHDISSLPFAAVHKSLPAGPEHSRTICLVDIDRAPKSFVPIS